MILQRASADELQLDKTIGESEVARTRATRTKSKRVPVKEQYSNLQKMCREGVPELEGNGVEIPEATIKIVGEGRKDEKTGAMVVNALVTISFLLTKFSGLSSWFQRKTFHHTRDPIYQRLIIAILRGYYVPPLRVAAVTDEGTVSDPTDADDWTLIDGLQRTTCYIIAALMAALGEQLVELGVLDAKTWAVFKHDADQCDVNELLRRQQQMEVFYSIDTAGVLHFMLLLNGAQRQMNAKIQLELMNIPLIKLLEKEGIDLVKEQEKAVDNRLEKQKFKGSNLIVSVQGYMSKDPHVKTSGEKEAFLGDEREFLSEPQDMDEVIAVLKLVTGPLHNAILAELESPIMSDGEVFLTALMAAAGKYAEMTSQKQMIAALENLVERVESGADPLDLDTYWDVYQQLKSGKGRKIRSIICSAFLEFFRGNSKLLMWEETAQVYS